MQHRFFTADVFTDKLFGGNPLAVFPNGDAVDPALMQRIANEFNLSETVFVLPPDDPGHTRRLRIFTPAVELPFAGHPTVGTAFVLAAVGDIEATGAETDIVFEEGVGPVPVRIRTADGRPQFSRLTTAVLPEQGPPPPPRETLAGLLALEPDDLVDDADHRAEAWSAGVPFLFVPLRDLDALARCKVDRAEWEASVADSWAPQFMPFTRATDADDVDIQARMFAPAMGITEDPATGAAAAAFAGYLASRDPTPSGTVSWVVAQGVEMGRPSRLHIDVDRADGAVTAVHVGGATVLVSEGNLILPD